MSILVTGAAGFIGYHLTQRLLAEGYSVIGIDNLNDYYDPKLKKDRLHNLEQQKKSFTFYKLNLADRTAMEELFIKHSFTHVVNLAAQAGVRYSIDNPHTYVDSNIVGFLHILEGCRAQQVKHLIYASSSSVYGANTKIPFSVEDQVDHPVSLYAATKKSNELMAHTYSHLYQIPTTGLRFFTVYGPWGRPDMAYFSFTKNIIAGEEIKVFNHGQMKRDFTYIDDIVEGIVRLLHTIPQPSTPPEKGTNPELGKSHAPYAIYNIGNNTPVPLMEFVHTLEELIGKKAQITLLPMQLGDVQETYADIKALQEAVGFSPATSIEDGLRSFVEWYKGYYL